MDGDGRKADDGSPGAGPEGPAPSSPSSVPQRQELLRSTLLGLVIGAAALGLLLPLMPARQAPPAPAPVAQRVVPPPRQLELGDTAVSPDARRIAQAVVDRADNGDLPFVVIDKREARLLLFHPYGRLAGATPILLGSARGDDSVPGIGDRPIPLVKPHERTTPAGRFIAERGRNALGEDVIWVDYDSAVSMHRVRLTNAKERRLQRLASNQVADRRISYGCINLPVAFFEQSIWPALRPRGGVIYVLPEKKRIEDVFPTLTSAAPDREARLAAPPKARSL